jgi:Flp pilus assembly protein CpaB
LVVAVLALITAMVAARVVGDAGTLAARYGPLRPVVVAARALDPGSVVSAGDVAVRRVPGSLVPDGAVPSTDQARGRTVVAPVFPGVPLVVGQLAPDGRRGLGALLPPGSRAVAVPNGRPALALIRGDSVDVLATFDPAGSAEGAPPTFPVAVGALVVDIGEDSAAVAVSPEEAARVAFALVSGVVTLALAAPVDPMGSDGAVSGSSSPEPPAPPVPPPPGR